MKQSRRVAYIMSRFPGLSETFILREMCEMEKLGWDLYLYPLIYQEEAVIHDEAKGWMKRAKRPSFATIFTANLRLLFTRPLVYFSTLFRVLYENIRSPKFFSRAVVVFPIAVWMLQSMTEEKVSHIHAHYATHPALAAWIIHRLSGIPYGITVHAHDIFVNRTMLRQKLLDAAYIVSISEFNRGFLKDIYGDWVEEKTHIIHCGISPEMYVVNPKSAANGRFELISIGSLRDYKGFTFLLDASADLKKSGFQFRCRIIGGGELRDSLLEKIKQLDIGDVVELLGPKNQNEVAALLQTADCYIQPSVITPSGKMEGIPVSLMEAMACQLPVIATNISGIPELVRHHETGWLVPPENPHALRDAVMEVKKDPDLAARRAAAGRDLVFREFSITRTTEFLSKLFNSIEDTPWK